jgi:hypothetical protein
VICAQRISGAGFVGQEEDMKTIVIASALAIVSTAALAQGRPSTTTMTCTAAHSLVVHQGAIVLGTGGQTYERIVRDTSFCQHGQKLRPYFAPTRDNGSCYVGDYCFDESLDPK